MEILQIPQKEQGKFVLTTLTFFIHQQRTLFIYFFKKQKKQNF